MDKLFTNLRFTSEDIESLGLQIAKVEFLHDKAVSSNKKIKQWLRSNCSATWGYSTTPRAYARYKDDGARWRSPSYIQTFYYIFTDEMDILSLKLAFDDAQIRCLWPSKLEFNMFLIEEDD